MMWGQTGVNPNWHEEGYFYLLVLFGSDFVSWIFIKNFQTFLEVKIDINQINLTPKNVNIMCAISVQIKNQQTISYTIHLEEK